MRASTLCFIALACLMTQFTQALPVNLKREMEVGSANTENGLNSSSAAGTGIEAPGSDAKALAAAAASKDKAVAVAAADSNGGPEFAKSKALDKNLGPVDLSAAGAFAGAVDRKKPGAAVVGALAGGAGVENIVSASGAITGGKAVGQGGAEEGIGGAGTVTVTKLGTAEIKKSGVISFARPDAHSSH